MGFGSEVSSAVEAARQSIESLGLQVDVVHRAWVGQDVTGAPRYGDPVVRKALVQEGRKQFQTVNGRVVNVKAIISFLPESEGAAPPTIDGQDSLILPDGTTGVIVEIKQTLVARGTGAPFLRTVWLG